MKTKTIVFVYQDKDGFTWGTEKFDPQEKQQLLGLVWVPEGTPLSPLEAGEVSLYILPPNWVEQYSE